MGGPSTAIHRGVTLLVTHPGHMAGEDRAGTTYSLRDPPADLTLPVPLSAWLEVLFLFDPMYLWVITKGNKVAPAGCGIGL